MENGGAEVCKRSSSYRYWVRDATGEAAPPPVPRKISADDVSKQVTSATLGSVWNQAGTWEEKNLNTWATGRIKELLATLDSLEFAGGRAGISEVSNCKGDAFLVTVRNKKRVGYTYEITLKFKGEWLVKEEKTEIKGDIDIHEFSFGELDDLQIEVTLKDEKKLGEEDRRRITTDIRTFVPHIQNKLSEFEEELKGR